MRQAETLLPATRSRPRNAFLRNGPVLVAIALFGCGREPAPPAPPAPNPPPPPAVETRALRLAAGSVVEAELAGGETHVYPFELGAGQYAGLVVDQRGNIDVAIYLYAPGDRLLTRVDSRYGVFGSEPLPVVAEGPVPRRLKVSSESVDAPAGRYALIVEELRPATARDRVRVRAERTFANAEAMRRQGDRKTLRDAVAQYEEALALLHELGDPGRRADVLYALGRVHHQLWESAAAVESYQKALPIFRALEEDRKLRLALTGLGFNLRRLGQLDRAIEVYQQSLAIERALGGQLQEGITLDNLGFAYATLGKAEKALRSYEQALAIFRRLDEQAREGVTLHKIGLLYERLGRREQALEVLSQALALLEAQGRTRSAATTLDLLGRISSASGQPQAAIDQLSRALSMARSVEDRSQEATTLNHLGLAYYRLELPEGRRPRLPPSIPPRGQSPDDARNAYGEALAIYRELGDHAGQATVLANLGLLQSQFGQAQGAVDSFRRALPLFAAAGDPHDEAKALYGLAYAHRAQGDLPASQAAIEQALERLETLRTEPASHQLRSSFFVSKQDYYSFYVDLLMKLHRIAPAAGYPARAFEANERARARSLLDLMAEAGAEVRTANRRSAALVQAVPLGLRKIQEQVLDDRTLLLQYALGNDRSFVWAVTPGSVHWAELAPRQVIEDTARRAHGLLASNQKLARAQTEIALAELSQLLLQPVAERLTAERLLVIADGALHFIPFAALPIPGRATRREELGRGDTAPLIVEHEVVTLPSASTLAQLRRNLDGQSAEGVAVLADPVFDAADPRIDARFRQRPERRTAEAERLVRLPFSRAEAEAIRELVPAAEPFLDFAAARTVLDQLGRYRILHFATHGLFDPEHPELSAIVLSQVDEQGRPREGFLRAHEIYQMDLAADLVVLSACQTALGKVVRGEGLLGLTRAFMVAGARRIVVSLWQVEDQATAELMRGFYREMRVHGRRPAAALRRAQMALRRQAGWEAPFYWAGFVLHGDG